MICVRRSVCCNFPILSNPSLFTFLESFVCIPSLSCGGRCILPFIIVGSFACTVPLAYFRMFRRSVCYYSFLPAAVPSCAKYTSFRPRSECAAVIRRHGNSGLPSSLIMSRVLRSTSVQYQKRLAGLPLEPIGRRQYLELVRHSVRKRYQASH